VNEGTHGYDRGHPILPDAFVDADVWEKMAAMDKYIQASQEPLLCECGVVWTSDHKCGS
jgi:hypothetical protein